MESHQTSEVGINCGGTSLPKVNCTPKNHKSSGALGEELGFYNLHREASPSFRAGQDILEVGWGDSPEPLNVEKKLDPNRTPLTCKKKLETRESPKSSLPFKRRNVRSTFSLPSKSIVDVAKYVAEVQELSKNIMKELSAKNVEQDLFESEELVSSKQLIENNRVSPVQRPSSETNYQLSTSSSNSNTSNQNEDPAFDNVIQSFINEEDDWLSQALSTQEQKTPHKGNFMKSKSENELTLPHLDKQNCRNINNNFRRTSSFDLTKPSNQYSLQEIERKRLEAKYRRERREIERRKLEALKKLEMKRLRAIKT